MIRSMTGYGSAEGQLGPWQVSVECRSVNHKNFDLRTSFPRTMGWLESLTQDLSKRSIKRGRLEVRVDLELLSTKETSLVDHEHFARVANQLRELALTHGLASPTIADVLSFRETLGDTKVDVPDQDAMIPLLEQALEVLFDSRAEEGKKLSLTLIRLIEEIEMDFEYIDSKRDEILSEYRERLFARVGETAAAAGVELEETRITQEVVIFADRSDIAEEVQRALSHCSKLRNLIEDEEDTPVGKRLDFYLQELIREANTTGSKSSSVLITDAVVRIKTAIEQLREQASNVE